MTDTVEQKCFISRHCERRDESRINQSNDSQATSDSMTTPAKTGRPPGPNEPVPAWPEYRQLREAVHDYPDNEPDDPAWNDI